MEMSKQGRRTFFGGTMAMASLGGMEMWCGRLSFSPFIDLRNCNRVSVCSRA